MSWDPRSSGYGLELGRDVDMSQDQGAGHEASAARGYSPSSRAWDLGDQAVGPEHAHQASDLTASLLADGIGDSLIRIEPADDVVITEALNEMLAAADGFEQRAVLRVERIESAGLTALTGAGTGQPMHLLVGLTGVLHVGEGLGIALAGGLAHLEVTGQIGDSLGHREVAQDAVSIPSASTQDFETPGLIDDRLDTQDEGCLVIHLDPVGPESMLDAGALRADLVVRDDLRLEVSMEFTTEEGQDIFGVKAADGMVEQLLIEAAQGCPVAEQDVHGQFALVADPIVAMGGQDRVHEGIDASGEGLQDSGPVLAGHVAGKALGLGQVVDPREGVIQPVILDGMAVHLLGEPGMAVEIDLDGKGHPALQADMHQSELAIEEVEVEEATLAGSDLESRPPISLNDLEAAAGFEGLQDGDKPFPSRLFLEDLLGELFFVGLAFEDEEGPALGSGQGSGVVGDLGGEAFGVDFEVLDKPVMLVE